MINLNQFKNYIYIKLKRRMPTCYLLSSKSLLTIAIILCVYFLTMDIILFGNARHRGPFKPFSTPSATTTTTETNIIINTILNNTKSSKKQLIGSVFKPLPVKKIMMAQGTHYLRSPLAELVENSLGFSELFPFVGPNTISVTHCVLSVISIKYLTHDSLFWRQIGVGLFQFRNFLDSFDGVIYRAHAKKSIYKSHYGSLGYFVDAFSDVFGGLCLIGSIAIYFMKRPPLNKNLTRCFRLASDNNDSSVTTEQSGTSDASILVLNEKTMYNQINYSFEYNQKQGSSCKENYLNSSIYATKPVVLMSIAMIGLRLALSALFWDRSVHAYEDLLDCAPKSELHQVNKNRFKNKKNSF